MSIVEHDSTQAHETVQTHPQPLARRHKKLVAPHACEAVDAAHGGLGMHEKDEVWLYFFFLTK
jgi:hypothetical protein